MLPAKRIIGIDLGVSSSHNACVLDLATGKVVARRKFVSKPDDLIDLIAIARAGLGPDDPIGVVMEATAGAWFAPAAWFGQHDIGVYRVSTTKASDLRKFFSRHVKTNTIDAETLARLALLAPESIDPLEFPDVHRAGLDRRVRATHRYVVQSTNHLIRIRQLTYHVMPRFNLAVTGAFAMSDLALLEKYANPHRLALFHVTVSLRSYAKHQPGTCPTAGRTCGSKLHEKPSNCSVTRPALRLMTSPPRSHPRFACGGPARPSSPATPRPAKRTTGSLTPTNSPGHYPA